MGSVVVYHFETSAHSASEKQNVSKRPGTREAIESLGFVPLMETAQVVDNSVLDVSGFVIAQRGEQPV
jgi:hypothetical protein